MTQETLTIIAWIALAIGLGGIAGTMIAEVRYKFRPRNRRGKRLAKLMKFHRTLF